ncbi:MAG: hypothetical protein FWC26_03500 [Fibromonadales bacterium]|nr:hypothetical protein [Fibromonadales bacterium]
MAQNFCLGVEISQDHLKIALVEPKRRHVVKVDMVPTSGNSMNDASIYASVLSSWARNNLPPASELERNRTAAVFPSCNGIMRLVAIPKELESGYGDYINWEFEHATDFKASDYNLDKFFIPNEKKPERVIVTAIERRFVERLDRSDFSPGCLMSDIVALLNLLEESEGLGSQPKCVLKADEKFTIAFWGSSAGFLAIRFLPKDCISAQAVIDILKSGFEEFPKAKRNVKLCGELSANEEFVAELAVAAKELKNPIEIQPWNSISKFSLGKNVDFLKLSQCLGAIGATLSCA